MIKTAEEFVRLRSSDHLDEYQRANNEPATEATWRQVIAHYPEMIFWVAQNKTVPHGILELLVSHPDPRIRCAIARKRKLTKELFERLAADEDESVRMTVALNKKVPTKVLADLINDNSSLVRDAARKNDEGVTLE